MHEKESFDMYLFNAQTGTVHDDGEAIIIGFSGNSQTPDNYVLLSKSKCPATPDTSTDTDGLYIEMNDQLCGLYNGVKSISLEKTCVRIQLTEQASHKLGIDPTISISIDFDAFGESCFFEF